MTDFPFNKLPLEIQRHIWTFAVPTSMVFCARVTRLPGRTYVVEVSPIAKWMPACVKAWNASKAARNCVQAIPRNPKDVIWGIRRSYYIIANPFPYDRKQDTIYFVDHNDHLFDQMDVLFRVFTLAYVNVGFTRFALQLLTNNHLAMTNAFSKLWWWIQSKASVTFIPLLADDDSDTLCMAVSRFNAHLTQLRGSQVHQHPRGATTTETPVYFGEDVGVGYSRHLSLHRPSFGNCGSGSSCIAARRLPSLHITATGSPEFYLYVVPIDTYSSHVQWRQTEK